MGRPLPTGPGQAQPRRGTCVHPPACPSPARGVIGVQCIVDQAARHLLKLAIGTHPEGYPKGDPEHFGVSQVAWVCIISIGAGGGGQGEGSLGFPSEIASLNPDPNKQRKMKQQTSLICKPS